MTTTSDARARRRTGAETRLATQQVALDLFTKQGYEATSLKQIAEALGINKASLYYHFQNKEDIVKSLFQTREDETEQLLAWIDDQPRSEHLIERAVLHWVDSFSIDKLRGIRLMGSNPLLTRHTGPSDSNRIGANLTLFVQILSGLLPNPTVANQLLLRMAILSINAAVYAAANTDISDPDILIAAHAAAHALVEQISLQP